MHSLEEFWQMVDNYPLMRPQPVIQNFLESLVRGELVDSVDVKEIQDTYKITYWFAVRSKIGFVSPTLAWAREIKKIVQDGTVLEIGAGTGLVAKYLNAAGIDIIATDNFSWYNSDKVDWEMYFDVEKIDYKDAIQKYPADYLLLCWPYMDSLAWTASEIFTKLNPEGKIIYIGESCGGCTADDKFFDGIETIDYLEEANKFLPQWSGLHDRTYLVKWVGVPPDYDETHEEGSYF